MVMPVRHKKSFLQGADVSLGLIDLVSKISPTWRTRSINRRTAASSARAPARFRADVAIHDHRFVPAEAL